jgi:predicted DNA-binding transcriptional regulator AlpA
MNTQKRDPIATIRLLSLREVCHAVGFSSWTVNDWTRAGKFPRPLVAAPGSPRRWRLSDIESWIEARRRARNTKPAARGRLNRGRSLGRVRLNREGDVR